MDPADCSRSRSTDTSTSARLDSLSGDNVLYKNYIFETVLAYGVRYGFQAFNKNPLLSATLVNSLTPASRNLQDTPRDAEDRLARLTAKQRKEFVKNVGGQYVASTIFLVADNLCKVLIDDVAARKVVRDGITLGQAFREAVWVQHSKLLAAYMNWCNTVNVPTRPVSCDVLEGAAYSDDEVIRLLLSEMALFSLIFSEAANVRHLTDGVSFIFWLCRFSPDFQQVLTACPKLSEESRFRCSGVSLKRSSLRNAVLQLRNNHWKEIDAATEDLCNTGVSTSIASTQGVVEILVETLNSSQTGVDAKAVAAVFLSCHNAIFLEEVIQPLFHLLAYLEDKLGGAGWETSTRLCYEDLNDCLTHKEIVTNTLALLGVEDPNLTNYAYQTMKDLGRGPDGEFDARRAAVWWEQKVFRKMFVERRGWLHVYRTFHYAFIIPVMLVQGAVIFQWTGGDLTYNICRASPQGRSNCFNVSLVAWSSLILTHCFFIALLDFSGWYLAKQPSRAPSLRDSLAAAGEKELLGPSLTKTLIQSTESSLDMSQLLKYRPVNIVPLGNVASAGIPTIILMLSLGLIYVMQFNPGTLGASMHTVWLVAASIYLAVMVLSQLLLTRDGFTIPIPCCGALTRLFQAAHHRYGDVPNSWIRVGWKSHWRTVSMWAVTFIIAFFSVIFANYNINFDLACMLVDYNSVFRGTWVIQDYDTGLPIPGWETIVAAMGLVVNLFTSMPLVMFIAFIVGTQVIAYPVGSRHGYGSCKTWNTFCKQFPEMPALFRKNCMPPPKKPTKESSSQVDAERMFSVVWNSIVEDFGLRDWLSDEEIDALSFLSLGSANKDGFSMAAPDELRIKTIWMPAFIQGPAVRRRAKFSLKGNTQGMADYNAVLDTLKLLLWTLFRGGALSRHGMMVLATPLIEDVPLTPQQLESARRLLLDGTALMSAVDAESAQVTTKILLSMQQYIVECGLNTDAEVLLRQAFHVAVDSKRGLDPMAQRSSISLIQSVVERMRQACESNESLIYPVRYLAQIHHLKDYASSKPLVEECEDLMRMFMRSMYHSNIGKHQPLRIVEMPSFSTLVPLYNEDVVPCLSEALTSQELGYTPTDLGQTRDTARVWLGLMTEVEENVSHMSYMKTRYAQEWRNFQQRMSKEVGIPPDEITEEMFLSGGQLHEYEWELLVWAGRRSQVLARNILGMCSNRRAFELLLQLECPKPAGWSPRQYATWLQHVVDAKYQVVVSAQTLGQKLIKPATARDCWTAKGIIALLNQNPMLRVVFLHAQHEERFGCDVQYSVQLKGRQALDVRKSLVDKLGGVLESGYRAFDVRCQSATDVTTAYVVRMPRNYFSNRGVIIGAGKPENHNVGAMWMSCEYVQSMDINMDHVLSEAMKVRNLLSEFFWKDHFYRVFPLGGAVDPVKKVLFAGLCNSEPLTNSVILTKVEPITISTASSRGSGSLKAGHPEEEEGRPIIRNLFPMWPGSDTTAGSVAKLLKKASSGPQLAVLGIAPYICTASAGPVAWMNSVNEHLFTYNIQRSTNLISRTRYHYGFGDIWNKVWAMTNTGLSRPVRGLHTLEDLPVGIRITQKGGIIKLRDYVMVGKCRETNIVGVLGYHFKVVAGVMEGSLGRDYFLLHFRADALRQICSYMYILMSHVSMRMVFISLWMRSLVDMMVLMFNVPILDLRRDEIPHNFALMPSWMPQTSHKLLWDSFVLGFWLLGIPLLMFGGELMLQHGWKRTTAILLRIQSIPFVIYNFVYLKWWDSASAWSTHHMAATYIATGRGFGLHRIPFVQMYTIFARSLHYYACMLIVFTALLLSDPGWYHDQGLYSRVVSCCILLIGGVMIVGPFWLTPLSFRLKRVLGDINAWWGWMHGLKEESTSTTWRSWHRKYMEPWHNTNGRVEDFWTSWLFSFIGSSMRSLIICYFCTHLIRTHTKERPPSAGSRLERTGLETDVNGPNSLALQLTFRTLSFWGCMLFICMLNYIFTRCRACNRSPSTYMVWRSFLTTIALAMGSTAFVLCYLPYLSSPRVYTTIRQESPRYNNWGDLIPRSPNADPTYATVTRSAAAAMSSFSARLFALVVLNVFASSFAVDFLVPWPFAFTRWVVEQAYWAWDFGLGLMIQTLLLCLSCCPLIQWLQIVTIQTKMGYRMWGTSQSEKQPLGLDDTDSEV